MGSGSLISLYYATNAFGCVEHEAAHKAAEALAYANVNLHVKDHIDLLTMTIPAAEGEADLNHNWEYRWGILLDRTCS